MDRCPETRADSAANLMIERFRSVRSLTEELAGHLSPEDQTVQSMPDVSPTKWHRAHVTWFFETFVLERFDPGHVPFDSDYRMLFNSYYEGVGPRFARQDRGLLSRPGAEEVGKYRAHVDAAVERLLELSDSRAAADPELIEPALFDVIELGLHHEQQHQELLLMDIKHVLSIDPRRPSYRHQCLPPEVEALEVAWVDVEPEALVDVGACGGFCFDNELPRHRVHLEPFRIANRLVTAGEWQHFMDDGGYRRPELWLSDGWHTACDQNWSAPLYWVRDGAAWLKHTLGGTRPVRADEPVCHVSHYEADAYARWAGARLPTEFEWEIAVARSGGGPHDDRDFDVAALEPRRATSGPTPIRQAFGECWQWTSSAYLPYPGFAPAPGAVGEYNGKFMSGQMVLRGGSSLTPPGHARSTYRNFFPPGSRWMMSGVRLAVDGVDR